MRSSLPSPLMSASAGEYGPLPVKKVCWEAKLTVLDPGVVVFISTETVFVA